MHGLQSERMYFISNELKEHGKYKSHFRVVTDQTEELISNLELV